MLKADGLNPSWVQPRKSREGSEAAAPEANDENSGCVSSRASRAESVWLRLRTERKHPRLDMSDASSGRPAHAHPSKGSDELRWAMPCRSKSKSR